VEEIYSIHITLAELAFIRQSLELITINGKDAHFLSNLQTRIENEIIQIQKIEQEQKNKELEKSISIDAQKVASKK
jgi:hypothetical protein